MFANKQILDVKVPDEIQSAFKSIQDRAKKYDSALIARVHPEYSNAMNLMSQDIDLLERQVLGSIANARSNLKASQAAHAKLNKELGAMQVLEKALDKHASAVLKAIKSGNPGKLPGIAKKAVSDGAKYLKLLKSTAASAKTMSNSYEETRKIMTKAQVSVGNLRASQIRVTPLSP